jgi:zinc transport system substrate-binding protein
MIRYVLSVFIFVFCFSCESKNPTKSEKPTVLVSVPPYVYFVKKIGKDAVEIETLVPAGANPHIYEAAPKEVQRHQSAALWIYLGEAFDKRALQFFKDVKNPIQVVDITKGIDLLSLCEEDELVTEHAQCHHGHEEGKDLHVWLSPKLAKAQAQKIGAALVALMPERQTFFETNLQALLSELDRLDNEITRLLEPLHGKAILVSHPAFGYFCHDYHLIQLSIEMEGKEPLPQHVTEILDKAKHYAVQAVLTEPQYSNKGAELIARSLHLPTHSVDPYAENYSENLLAIAKVIAE